jgi:hypothetical protein
MEMSQTDIFKPNKKQRFSDGKITEIKEASVEHFQDSGSGRDRFGNRIFTSNLGYLDRENHPVKAAILVSKEGEKFITDNIGILNAIDFGLRTLMTEGQSYSEKVIDLGKGREMKMLKDPKNNGNNLVYLLTVGGEKYVIKVKKTKIPDGIDRDDVSQPFINEMLQAQETHDELGDKLQKMNVQMPKFLFASGQVSCVEFVEGNHLTGKEIEELIFDTETGKTLLEYVESKRHTGGSLWKDIHPDIVERGGIRLRKNNFIKRSDGSIVFIDPFYYEPNK